MEKGTDKENDKCHDDVQRDPLKSVTYKCKNHQLLFWQRLAFNEVKSWVSQCHSLNYFEVFCKALLKFLITALTNVCNARILHFFAWSILLLGKQFFIFQLQILIHQNIRLTF